MSNDNQTGNANEQTKKRLVVIEHDEIVTSRPELITEDEEDFQKWMDREVEAK